MILRRADSINIVNAVMTSTDPDAFDASPGDLLTVVELNALQTVAAL